MIRVYFLTLFFVASSAFGQSKAFDKDVYFPNIDIPEEIQIKKGTNEELPLGTFVKNIGPGPLGGPDRFLIKNVGPFWGKFSIVNAGSDFNLNNLSPIKQNLSISPVKWQTFHFRSKQYTDLLVGGTIYWADDAGNYDDANKTDLLPSKSGDWTSGSNVMEPFVSDFNGDGIDDIVMGTLEAWHDASRDSNYLELFYGGEKLHSQKKAYSDSIALLSHGRRMKYATYQADFRGTGRESLLAFDKDSNDFFFFKNDPSQSLSDLAHSLVYDTLISSAYDSQYYYEYSGMEVLPMQAFPKATWDKSVDLLISLPIGDNIPNNDHRTDFISFFKGGPDFGNTRLLIDSPDFKLHYPGYYDPAFRKISGGPLHNCGDMTGTGNNVLHFAMAQYDVAYEMFYVTGKALDDKVDMTYYLNQTFSGDLDTLHGNDDKYGDILLNEWDYPVNKGKLYYIPGTSRIPVKLNPLFSVKEQTIPQGNIDIYPNPLRDRAIVSFSSKQTERAVLKLYNVLGQTVYEEEKEIYSGAQSFKLQIPSLVTGSYLLEITSPTQSFKTHLAITK